MYVCIYIYVCVYVYVYVYVYIYIYMESISLESKFEYLNLSQSMWVNITRGGPAPLCDAPWC